MKKKIISVCLAFLLAAGPAATAFGEEIIIEETSGGEGAENPGAAVPELSGVQVIPEGVEILSKDVVIDELSGAADGAGSNFGGEPGEMSEVPAENSGEESGEGVEAPAENSGEESGEGVEAPVENPDGEAAEGTNPPESPENTSDGNAENSADEFSDQMQTDERTEEDSLLLDIQEVEPGEYASGDEVFEIIEEDALSLNESGLASDAFLSRLRSGVAEYNGCYGNQLYGDAAQIYQAFAANYAGKNNSAAFEYKFAEPLTFAVFPTKDSEGNINWNLKENEEYQNIIQPQMQAMVQPAYDAFIYDHPEVFWLGAPDFKWAVACTGNSTTGTGTGTISGLKLIPKEKYEGASLEIKNFEASVNQVSAVISASFGGNTSQLAKVCMIHDYLCDNLSYGDNIYAHTAAGAFIKNGVVVCEGYAKAFKILCDRFGIETVLIPGGALKSDGSIEGHMWNYVRMENGNWYMIDPTWDDQQTYISRAYFLVGDNSRGFNSNITIAQERIIYNNFSDSDYGQSFGVPVLSANRYGDDVTGHEHYMVEKEKINATCKKEGYVKYGCCVCSVSGERKTLPIIEHSFVTYEFNKDATCVLDGTKTAFCQYGCGLKNTIPAPGTALGHSFTNYVSNGDATCTADGTKTAVCDRCKKEKQTVADSGSKLGHKYGAYVSNKNATALKDGTKTRTCTRCGQKETVTDKGSKLPASIKLNASSVTLKTGQTTTALKVTGLAKGDSIKKCKSADTSKVKVTLKSGKITLKAQKKTGKTSVTITLASGLTKKVSVTVQKAAVETKKITGLSKKVTLTKGQKITLKPVLSPITSTEKITYSSSNKKAAAVSSKGVVTAKGAGTAKITVKSGSKRVTVSVTVKKTATTKLTGVPKTLTLKKGKSTTLKVKRTPANSDEGITYKTSNKKVAAVSSKGKITAKKKGTATITVKSGKITVKCKVTVK